MSAAASSAFAFTTTMSTITAHEAAVKKIYLSDIWERMERARVEVGLLVNMAKEGLGVPQVTSIIHKLGGSRKSARGGLGGSLPPKH